MCDNKLIVKINDKELDLVAYAIETSVSFSVEHGGTKEERIALNTEYVECKIGEVFNLFITDEHNNIIYSRKAKLDSICPYCWCGGGVLSEMNFTSVTKAR